MDVTPTTSSVRTALDLDERFFPRGVNPGCMVEVKGPENSGKTFLLTYFLAQFLTRYPSKRALLINTSYQFSLRNLACILLRLDPDLNLDETKSLESLSTILENNPKLPQFLERLILINCYTPEEYILTLGPDFTSMLHQMLQNDPNISLVVIDTVDNYSIVESIGLKEIKRIPDIFYLIKKAVRSTQTPVIFSTIMNTDFYERKTADQFRKTCDADAEATLQQGSTTSIEESFSNIKMDSRCITHTLSISMAIQAEKVNIIRPAQYQNAHYATAYLRSRHKANTAGSANHRVKFSIFSDMLWIDDS